MARQEQGPSATAGMAYALPETPATALEKLMHGDGWTAVQRIDDGDLHAVMTRRMRGGAMVELSLEWSGPWQSVHISESRTGENNSVSGTQKAATCYATAWRDHTRYSQAGALLMIVVAATMVTAGGLTAALAIAAVPLTYWLVARLVPAWMAERDAQALMAVADKQLRASGAQRVSAGDDVVVFEFR